MVRPESVTVTADPAGTASVSSVAFLGPISRVYCTLHGRNGRRRADGQLGGAGVLSPAIR